LTSSTGLRHPLIGAIQPLEAVLPEDIEAREACRLDDAAFGRWLAGRIRFFATHRYPDDRYIAFRRTMGSFLLQIIADYATGLARLIIAADMAVGLWSIEALTRIKPRTPLDGAARRLRKLLALLARLMTTVVARVERRPLPSLLTAGGKSAFFIPLD
jgi:hypothetical protein